MRLRHRCVFLQNGLHVREQLGGNFPSELIECIVCFNTSLDGGTVTLHEPWESAILLLDGESPASAGIGKAGFGFGFGFGFGLGFG